MKASNFLVAILKTDRQVEGVKYDSDYLWIKCHGVGYSIRPTMAVSDANMLQRVTVKTLRQQYTVKFMPEGDLILKHQKRR